MKILLLFLVITCKSLSAQNTSFADNLGKRLKSHIEYLADDKLEGRRAGSAGEKLAYSYIIRQFKDAGIQPISGANFLQPFELPGVKVTGKGNRFLLGSELTIHKDYFPMAYSGNGTVSFSDLASLDTFNIAPLLEQNSSNPHFDIHAAIINRAKDSKQKGKKALIIFNTSTLADKLQFDEKDKIPAIDIPVVFLNKNYLEALHSVGRKKQLNIHIETLKRTGHNVIGLINNNARNTVVVGAHYDHLGYGEDRNSLYSGKEKMVHNGADDNASGTAALIELARMLKKSNLKNNNYVFVAFSGEEVGLYGSKYFIEHSSIKPDIINYMINMDMLGRLNDSTHGITVGGYGTSPQWSKFLVNNDPYLKFKFDSSGTGPSDHTSFYRKDIPVLFFFTGTHSDYHKPSDDAHKINITGQVKIVEYILNLIKSTDTAGKLSFIKTREATTMGKTSFRVSLGIMPDYTFSGSGVLVDGVSDGKAAQKAGIKPGDVLFQLGDHKFNDVQTYMNALNQFQKGEAAKVKVMRGKEEIVFDIVF